MNAYARYFDKYSKYINHLFKDEEIRKIFSKWSKIKIKIFSQAFQTDINKKHNA